MTKAFYIILGEEKSNFHSHNTLYGLFFRRIIFLIRLKYIFYAF